MFDEKSPLVGIKNSNKTEYTILASSYDDIIMKLKKEVPLSKPILDILISRGYDTKSKIEKFLSADLSSLHDPLLLKDAGIASDIIINSIQNNEHMTIFGDFDADGVSATALMCELLLNIGANISSYNGNRFTEGYGLTIEGVQQILFRYPDTKLIITVDNGVTSFDAISYTKSLGIKVVVTDHHEPKETLPSADAIVNPKQKDDHYPNKYLCGTGVAFKLMTLIYQKLNIDLKKVYYTLDIVAVATIGDICDLDGENRVMVKLGMKLLRKETRKSFKSIKSSLKITEINSHYTIPFLYVPILNAVGRVNGNPEEVVKFLYSEDQSYIDKMTEELINVNNIRKGLTENQMKLAEEIYLSTATEDDKVIIIKSKDFHPGIVGLIAGRITDKFNKPSIILTEENGILKGSARSIQNFNLFESLTLTSDYLIKFGGHAAAAGLALNEANLSEFSRKINKIANDTLTEKDFVKKAHIDCKLRSSDINANFLRELSLLEPFGPDFAKPLFLLTGVVNKISTMGQEKNHLKINLSYLDSIFWSGAEYIDDLKSIIDAVGYPQINNFCGRQKMQFIISDLITNIRNSDLITDTRHI